MAGYTYLNILENDRPIGKLYLEIGNWLFHTIQFFFTDTAYKNAGMFHFDAQKGELHLSYLDAGSSGKGLDQILRVMNQICLHYRYGHSPSSEQVAKLYDREYQDRHQYSERKETHIRIKEVQADLILSTAKPKKILEMGCGIGELLNSLRKRKLEAWGFDIVPNIQEKAIPEIKEFIRLGSSDQIPYEENDQFDCFVSIDVFEHIPENSIPSVIKKIHGLGVEHLFTVINHHEFFRDGHITMRPLSWWADKFSPFFEMQFLDYEEEEVYSTYRTYEHRFRYWKRAQKSLDKSSTFKNIAQVQAI